MKVYPWRSRKYRSTARSISSFLLKISRVLWPIAAILSIGVTVIARFWALRGFSHINDAWAKRGLILTSLGLILIPLIGRPAQFGDAWTNLIESFTDTGTTGTGTALLYAAISGLPAALIIQGISSMIEAHDFDLSGERYLERTKPNWHTKRRAKKNEAALAAGTAASDDMIAFGTVAGDPIPFRTPRHGMLVERRFETLGHGSVVGGNGTGKTVLAITLGHTAVTRGAALVYLDFKASLRTYEAVKELADSLGVRFQSFTSGLNSEAASWYDPLAWEGDAADKASMLVSSFNFSETGDASFYKSQAETWLVLCFQVLEHITLRPGESTFDFLLAATDPVELQARMDEFRNDGDEDTRNAYTELSARARQQERRNLANLYANLSTVVHSGGDRMRPQGNKKPVSLADTARDGGVIYVGLSSSINDVALKIMGSLVLRDLGVLAGQRMDDPNASQLRPMMAIVDEASRLGHRAVVMENLLATAREGRILLWSFTQSFSTWPESTITELNQNANTKVAFRAQDKGTRTQLEDDLGKIPALNEMREETIKHRTFQGDTTTRDGDARKTMTDGAFLLDAPHSLGSIPDMHAYIWFTGDITGSKVMQWVSRRVKKPDIEQDAPLIKITRLRLKPTGETAAEEFAGADDEPQPLRAITDHETVDADVVTGWGHDVADPYEAQHATPSWDERPANRGPITAPTPVAAVDNGPAPMGVNTGSTQAAHYPRRRAPVTPTAPSAPQTRGGTTPDTAAEPDPMIRWADASPATPGPSPTQDPHWVIEPPIDEEPHWSPSEERRPAPPAHGSTAAQAPSPSPAAPIWDDDPTPDTAPIPHTRGSTPSAGSAAPGAAAEFAPPPTSAAASGPRVETAGEPDPPTDPSLTHPVDSAQPPQPPAPAPKARPRKQPKPSRWD